MLVESEKEFLELVSKGIPCNMVHKVVDYRQIFISETREKIYRGWIRINKGGTLRQFQKYLDVLEECLEVRSMC